jgi:hypothetical protein
LQASFLLPPFGYALMMTRGVAERPAPFHAFLRALLPYLLAQWLLLSLVLLVPQLVHVGENKSSLSRAPSVPKADVDRQLQELPLPPLPEPR